MTNNTKGYLILIGALGMLLPLLSNEITTLNSWTAAAQPVFVGKVMMHIGAVITAFIGGKVIPSNKE